MATKKSAAKKSVVKKTAAKKKPISAARTKGTQKTVAAVKKSAAKKTAAKAVAAPVVPPDAKQLAHGLHALLHTMQNVERYEERLCSMMHALEHGRSPNAALLRDLRATLQGLPVDDYRDDVQDLLDALG